MPAIILQTSVKLDDEQKNLLAAELSKICATEIGKPEDYVASIVNDDLTIFFGGKAERAALVEVKSIGGLKAKVNNALADKISQLLGKKLEITPNNIHINFIDFSANNWAWNGKTIG
jgi:phenylpyruvate tautomerase PptA (4-oxalocrotonate tautomerase family)